MRLNENVTTLSSYPKTAGRLERFRWSIFWPTDSRIRVANMLPRSKPSASPSVPLSSLSRRSSDSLSYFLLLPRNWYYYGPVRPSHYVINVTRVDYRSLFRTCLQCPRTMLDPLPPPPQSFSPPATLSTGGIAHERRGRRRRRRRRVNPRFNRREDTQIRKDRSVLLVGPRVVNAIRSTTLTRCCK